MSIKNKFNVVLSVSITLAIIFTSVSWFTDKIIQKAANNQKYALTLQRNILDLNVVLYEYVNNPRQSKARQWHKKHSSTIQTIIRGMVAVEKGNPLITSINRKVMALSSLFRKVEFAQQRKHVLKEWNASVQKISSMYTLSEKVSSQALINMHAIMNLVSALAEQSLAVVTKVKKRSQAALTMLSYILIFVILWVLLMVRKSITGPLGEITRGTLLIGAGNMEHIIPVKGEDELGLVAASFNKMTLQLKVSRNALVESKEHVESIIKSIIDTLIALTPDGKIQTINQATLDLLGYNEKELTGKPFSLIIAEEEEEEEEASPFLGTRFEKLVKEGSLRNFNVTYKTKSGEKIPMSFSGAVMRDKQDKVVGIVGIAKDMREYNQLMEQANNAAAAAAAAITEAKKAAELEKAYGELKNTQAQLIHAEKMTAVGTLAAGAAHELNNPLGGCRGIVELMLQSTDKKADNYDDLSLIYKQLAHCTEIVTNMLAFSRRQRAPLKKTPVQCNDAIKEAFKTIKFHFEKGGINVKFDLDNHLPTIAAASNQLQQVIINFLTNAKYALEHSDKKLKEIKIVSKQQDSWVVIEVSDNGTGMTQKEMTKAFDPFFTTKDVGEGTGLGLSVSHGIIKDHEGEISVKSKKGQGSTFTVKLPIEKTQKKAA